MAALQVRLFGRFDLSLTGGPATSLHSRRARELLCYLVLHHGHPQRRETLAGLLWDDASPAQAGKHLRQALWQLQAALRLALHPLPESEAAEMLEVDPEWVQLNPSGHLAVDVIRFEAATQACHGLNGIRLGETQRSALEHAVELYRGDLLEGWYQDWCLLERERLQNDLLDALEKLVCACEAGFENELGLVHARRMLALDPAREQVHRHMMRLHQQSGNRTDALREFQRCERVLKEELGVEPSLQTRSLYESIRDGRAKRPEASDGPSTLPSDPRLPELADLLNRAHHLFASLESRLQGAAALTQRPDQPD